MNMKQKLINSRICCCCANHLFNKAGNTNGELPNSQSIAYSNNKAVICSQPRLTNGNTDKAFLSKEKPVAENVDNKSMISEFDEIDLHEHELQLKITKTESSASNKSSCIKEKNRASNLSETSGVGTSASSITAAASKYSNISQSASSTQETKNQQIAAEISDITDMMLNEIHEKIDAINVEEYVDEDASNIDLNAVSEAREDELNTVKLNFVPNKLVNEDSPIPTTNMEDNAQQKESEEDIPEQKLDSPRKPPRTNFHLSFDAESHCSETNSQEEKTVPQASVEPRTDQGNCAENIVKSEIDEETINKKASELASAVVNELVNSAKEEVQSMLKENPVGRNCSQMSKENSCKNDSVHNDERSTKKETKSTSRMYGGIDSEDESLSSSIKHYIDEYDSTIETPFNSPKSTVGCSKIQSPTTKTKEEEAIVNQNSHEESQKQFDYIALENEVSEKTA